jgi:hypothetical protein
MLEVFRLIVEICGGLSVIFALVLIFIKPVRERILRDDMQREGMKCLLRGRMLNVYYKNKDTETIRQYEYENFCAYYETYKALGGNSFIEHIAKEVFEWEVIS